MAFCLFVFSKQMQVFWNFLQKFVIEIYSYAKKVKCFIFVEKNIQVVKLDQFKQRVHSNFLLSLRGCRSKTIWASKEASIISMLLAGQDFIPTAIKRAQISPVRPAGRQGFPPWCQQGDQGFLHEVHGIMKCSSSALPYTTPPYTAIHCTSLHCTTINFTELRCTALQWSTVHWIVVYLDVWGYNLALAVQLVFT